MRFTIYFLKAMLERQSLVSNSGSESTLEERENDVGSVCLGMDLSTLHLTIQYERFHF